jgi:hypothetical protein
MGRHVCGRTVLGNLDASMADGVGYRLATEGGSWPKFVKRGGLEVLPYFPAHGREGEAAPLLRRNLLILLVQVAILMASRTLAKNQKVSRQDTTVIPWRHGALCPWGGRTFLRQFSISHQKVLRGKCARSC